MFSPITEAKCRFAESTFAMYLIAKLLWSNQNTNVPPTSLAPRRMIWFYQTPQTQSAHSLRSAPIKLRLVMQRATPRPLPSCRC